MVKYGLKENEVLDLRKKFGENMIPIKEGTPWLFILFSQIKSPLIYILIIISVISLLFKEYTDVILILSVIAMNTAIGFLQEYHVERTLSALRKILKPTALVIREGKRKEIDAKDLVPGDLVLLGAGDRVPADGFLLETANFLVNESILTGEEEAQGKSEKEGKNAVFMGTTVIFGKGVMEVSKTGRLTEFGKIEESLAGIKKEKTPIQLKLDEFSGSLAKVILVVCSFLFFIGLLYSTNVWETFRFAIILAVAAIPEGLPIAITVILALGIRKILKRKGLVKRLISIETLGSTSVICTDKTGTLTEGNMKVSRTDFKNEESAFLALTTVNNQRTNLEFAIWNYLKSRNFNPEEVASRAVRIYEEPFDSEKKYALSLVRAEAGSMTFMAGAPEIILSFCAILDEERNIILAKIEEWANEGLKILGVAEKQTDDFKERTGFAWLGLLAIEDPIRKEAKEAILAVQKAGIKVKIVTGDYRKTAERIIANLGINLKPENVMEGSELELISEEDLKNRISDIILFSRVTPHQKQKIVKALQDGQEIVAMTGDGVNDALALKKADVGIAVGNATDVTKESADLILLDSNFKTIYAAVEEGRLIFSNIKKVVAYVLSNSFVEIFLIFGAMVLNLPLPLTIVQILWLHIICDGPPDIVLGFEPKEKGLMRERPENLRREKILSNSMKLLIFGISFIIGLLCLFLFWCVLRKNGDLSLARTMVFAAVAVVDLIYIFSFKNFRQPFFKDSNFFKNKFLFLGVAYGLILTIAAIYLPFLNRILDTQPLGFSQWLVILAVALVTTAWAELVKFLYYRKGNSLDR